MSGGLIQVDMLDKEMIPILGRRGQDGTKFHHAAQNNAQFQPYELFISEFFTSYV